jgi:glycosyltransferase involved in cell wall biosynthesis
VSQPKLVYLCYERLMEGGAAFTHVHEIVEGLKRCGLAVTLLAESATERDKGLSGQLNRYARLSLAGIKALRHHDIVYVRSHFAAFLLCCCAKMLGKPVIHEINGSYGDAFVTHPHFNRVKRVLSFLQRLQYRWAAHLIAVTPDLMEWAKRESLHDRVSVVMNAANTRLFKPDGVKTERTNAYVLFFGGLTRWHGVDAMLEAATLPTWPSNVDLLLAGPIIDTSLKSALDHAPSHVFWLGPYPQAELPPLIRGALAVLVPITDPEQRSSHGVLPLKLFEALACGVPVIVTDLKGQADIVRQAQCGLVVPLQELPQHLAAAIGDLAARPEEAAVMGKRGAECIHTHHSWDQRAMETAAMIKALT